MSHSTTLNQQQRMLENRKESLRVRKWTNIHSLIKSKWHSIALYFAQRSTLFFTGRAPSVVSIARVSFESMRQSSVIEGFIKALYMMSIPGVFRSQKKANKPKSDKRIPNVSPPATGKQTNLRSTCNELPRFSGTSTDQERKKKESPKVIRGHASGRNYWPRIDHALIAIQFNIDTIQ